MTLAEEKLIADYLAGEDVERALLEALAKNPELYNEVAKHQVLDRQLRAAVNGLNAEDFTASVLDLIGVESSQADGSTGQGLALPVGDVLKPDPLTVRTPKATVNNRRYSFWALASIACISVLLISTWLMIPYRPALGSISKVAGLAQHAVKVGQSINEGTLTLAQGYAEITLTNNVVLLLEGPARVEFHSADHLVLTQGSLVARVPPNAIGFSVDTPSSEIVDLGTEFGVRVTDIGESQVHVLDGEVKVRAGKEEHYEHLSQNQARAYDLQQQVAEIQSQPERFMRALPGQNSGTLEYLHWSFDQAVNDAFPCMGPGINNQCYPAYKKSLKGGNTGPNMIAGPFGNAVYFDGQHNWLETSFSGIGENKPRTVTFWAKVPSVFSVEQGFGILSWGLSDVLSAWQISPNPLAQSGPLGRIRVGTNMGEIIGTTDLRDDQWHHIAIVLFGGEGANLSTHVLMYIDGQLERSANKSIARVHTRLNHPQSKPLMMGRNLAFTGEVKPSYPRRFFRGGLDEVYIFDSALNQQQLLTLMQKNKAP